MTDNPSIAEPGRGERLFARGSAAVMTMVVGAVLGTYIYGASSSPHHVTRGAVELTSSPADVVALLHDVERRAEWRPNVVRIGRKSDPTDTREVWRELDEQDDRFDLEVLQRPDDGLVVRTDAAEQIGYEATWTFRVQAAGTGSRLEVVEEGFVDNPLFRGVFWLRDGPREVVTKELTWLSAALDGAPVAVTDLVVVEREGPTDGSGAVGAP